MTMAMARLVATGPPAACCCSTSASTVRRTLKQGTSGGYSSVEFLRRTKAVGTVRRQRSWQILSTAEDDYLELQAQDLLKIEEFMPDFDELDRDELQEFLNLELETSLDFETYKHYEIIFLVHEKHKDEVQAVIKKVQDFIAENKGLIHRLNDWGLRNLAYKIKKASRANYVLMNIEVKSQAINYLNTLFEKDERVIRHMVMSQKVAITEECEAPEEYRPSRIGEEEQEKEDEEEGEGQGEEEDEDEESELVLQRE